MSAAGGAPNGSAAAPPRDAKRARPADARLPRYHSMAPGLNAVACVETNQSTTSPERDLLVVRAVASVPAEL